VKIEGGLKIKNPPFSKREKEGGLVI